MKFFVFLLFISSICFGQENNDSISVSNLMENDPLLKMLKGKKFHVFFARDNSGNKISSKETKGKIVFINFWFEACAPCIAEFSSLNEFYEKYKANKDFKFISFSFEEDSVIKRIKKAYQLNYPIYHLSRDSCKLLTFGIQGYPSNYILNQMGRVAFVGIGGPVDKDKAALWFKYLYEAQVNKLLFDPVK